MRIAVLKAGAKKLTIERNGLILSFISYMNKLLDAWLLSRALISDSTRHPRPVFDGTRILLYSAKTGTVTLQVLLLAVGLVVFGHAAGAQSSPAIVSTFSKNCATCHDSGQSSRGLDKAKLMAMSPELIYASLSSGKMATFAAVLTDKEKKSIAEFLAGRPLSLKHVGDASTMKSQCPDEPFADPFSGPLWNGWGVDMTNGRFQPASDAGLKPNQIPHLKIKWAFGFPNSTSAYSQPTVAGGRVYVGSNSGFVYSLNARTGCVYWSFEAKASVRSAISIGPPIGHSSPPQYPIYFGDIKANVYSVDAATGKLIWMRQADAIPGARVTAAPKLFEGRLYVPVSSWEAMGRGQHYECCKFRGSIVALDVATGGQIWKAYTIPKIPQPLKKTKAGAQQWGPSGGAVWNSPTIDAKRRVLYAGTGDSYTSPAVNTTDAVLCFSLDTGELLWTRQLVPKDVGDTDTAPDFDIGSSVILRKLESGRDVLVVSQKAGIAYALDPDHQGQEIWRQDTGQGSRRGGTMWGSAADDRAVYIPNVDIQAGPAEAGGLSAIRLSDGKKIWHVMPPVPACKEKVESCVPGQSAAVTLIPGVLFSGTTNGVMRAYSTEAGQVLWEFDAMGKSFATVNGVEAQGGSFNGSGPTVVAGMVFVTSGYGYGGDTPGNVLLAFGAN
jgi:polyvinyl alcohol dehydrogenase (cytochrome)